MVDAGQHAASQRREAEDQPGERKTDQHKAAPIQRTHVLLSNIWNEAAHQQDPGNPDRQIEKEDPMPGEIRDDEAANRWPQQGTQHGRNSDVVHRRDQLLPGHAFDDDDAPNGCHHGAAHALNGAHDHQ